LGRLWPRPADRLASGGPGGVLGGGPLPDVAWPWRRRVGGGAVSSGVGKPTPGLRPDWVAGLRLAERAGWGRPAAGAVFAARPPRRSQSLPPHRAHHRSACLSARCYQQLVLAWQIFVEVVGNFCCCVLGSSGIIGIYTPYRFWFKPIGDQYYLLSAHQGHRQDDVSAYSGRSTALDSTRAEILEVSIERSAALTFIYRKYAFV